MYIKFIKDKDGRKDGDIMLCDHEVGSTLIELGFALRCHPNGDPAKVHTVLISDSAGAKESV